MPPATASAATPAPRPVLMAAAAAAVLRVLFGLGANGVLYGSLAALWAASVASVIHILGRWVCGDSSAVTGAGEAIFACAMCVLVPLLPASIPLLLMRLFEYVKDKKQCPGGGGAPCLPKVAPPAAYVVCLSAVMLSAIWMRTYAEKGTIEWTMSSLLLDIGTLGFAFSTGFVIVPNMVILVMGPRAKHGDTTMQ